MAETEGFAVRFEIVCEIVVQGGETQHELVGDGCGPCVGVGGILLDGAFGCVGGHVVQHEKCEEARDFVGASAASGTTDPGVLTVVREELEMAEHEAGARYSSGMVAWPGSDGSRHSNQHLGTSEPGDKLEWCGDVER